MSNNRDTVGVPTPYEGWTTVADAFDDRSDPNRTDDFETNYQPGHGRLLAELDVTVDRDGNLGGLIQFVHKEFATDLTSPRLAALLADAFDVVREHQRERAYLEVEYYEDGYTVFGAILDASALEELDRRVGMSSLGPARPTRLHH